MQEHFWDFFVSTKHKSFYYIHFQNLFNRINWLLSAFLNITTVSSIAAWGIWDQYPLIWAIILCASQMIQIFFPKLPFNDQLISVRFIISEIERLLIDIESEWLKMEIRDIPDEDMHNLLVQYQLRLYEITNRYFSGYYLPVLHYCESKAEQDCKNYFSVTYKV